MRAVELTDTNCPRGLTIQRSRVLGVEKTKQTQRRKRRKREEESFEVKSACLVVSARNSESRVEKSYKRNNPGGDRAVVPPDPIPNSEVKRRCADGSVGLPHVRVGHRQVLNVEPRAEWLGVFVYGFLLKII